jgi:hypothetical protein
VTALVTRRPRAHPPTGVSADRQRHAKEFAYLGCAGALGYGGMKVIWALGGTIGIRNPKHFHAVDSALPTAGQRFFDQWGTPILAGVAIVVLLALVYPWGDRAILRPLIRTCAWVGSLLMGGWGVVGLILTILYIAGDHGAIGVGDLDPGTYLFTYICFPMIGVGLAGAAWLTRRPRRSSAPRALSAST